ncbi:MAG TPA: DcaP family trimeric outer membrane transporter [Edaphobacter sp.]
MLKIVPLLFVLSGATQMTAQDAANTRDGAMHRLQIRMDELRAQMAQIQVELDAIHGENKLSKAVKDVKHVPESVQTGAIERTMPPLPPAVRLSPEQQREAIGEQTADYETFSEDTEAAPRLYNAPLEATMPGFFVLPGTQTMLRINGRLKTDFIFDPRPAGVQDAFLPASIPIPQVTSTHNFTVSIRQSRISTDFRVPVSGWGTARMFMQYDFFGARGPTTPRLRHLYAQLHNILVGQTSTNFMDADAWPDRLDRQGPNSGVNVRSPQGRYSFPLGRGMSGAISVEQPNSNIRFSQNGSAAVPITPAPDGALKFRYEMERGHFQVSSIFRELAVRLPNGGPQESAFGWGLNASGAVRVYGRDNVVYQVAYGNGISRYVRDTVGRGLDAAPRTETDLTLKALPLLGPYISYQHYWTGSVRSAATFGFLQVQNTAFQPGNTFHKSTYSSANIIWNTVGSLNLGAEFLYGWVEQKGGARANAPRIQFSGEYNLVKLHRD